MTRCFGYVRVSTAKQGEKGVSLQEQRAAIERFATRNGLTVVEWFEERETAAKRGRPVFARMLRLLRRRAAEGLIVHKIDRSARNLRDWADLGELIDSGVTVHFANESLDLRSRGGRLSADIQAVVAADYIRNLREETRKGFYGRLAQGLYPLEAPIGYLDNGSGRPKTVDPERGPLIRRAFELYATGRYSLRVLAAELHALGLRHRRGGSVRINNLSLVLNNPFYTGLIRLKKTGETFEGVHEALVSASLFRRVQGVLRGKVSARELRHDLLFRRLVRCAECGSTLIGERQKGHVYYRCHSRACAMTGVREEVLDGAVSRSLDRLRFTVDEKRDFEIALEQLRTSHRNEAGATGEALNLRLARIGERLARLTDAFVDGSLEADLFRERKEALLMERRELEEQRRTQEEQPPEVVVARVASYLELAERASLTYAVANNDEKRDLLQITTSNLRATRQNGLVELSQPFSFIANRPTVLWGAPHRDAPRTLAQKSTITLLASELYMWVKENRSAQATLGVAEMGNTSDP